jgi:FixJ family two-component response regulator
MFIRHVVELLRHDMMRSVADRMTLDVLVVDDEPLIGRAVRRMAAADVSTRCTSSKLGVIELLRDRGWPCAVALIDVRLGDEPFGGFEVLDVALAERPEIKCILVTGAGDIAVERQAFARRVPILPKPFTKQEIESILDDARPRPTPAPRDALGDCIERRSLAWRLSPKQREVLQRLARNEKGPHEETARALGMKLNTLRAHVREILERSGLASVDALRDTLLRDSLSLSARGGPDNQS